MKQLRIGMVMAALAMVPLQADTKKLSQEHRQELVRGLTAEWATAKVVLPMSKKALPFDSSGTWDQAVWRDTNYKNGPAARPGDMVQITKVKVDDDKITVEINDGSKKGSFMDRVQVGGAATQAPVTRSQTNAQMGTSIEIKFPDSVANIDSAGVKKLLAGVLDFSKRSSTEVYMESLPEPIREAIKAQKAAVGMDREQVNMAVGRPRDTIRYTKDDVDYEEWIYGRPPGVIRFVKFAGAKVTAIHEDYAGINGSIATEGGAIK